MVGGSLYTLIYMLVLQSYAADFDEPLDDALISVGLMYRDGVPVSYETTTLDGYTVGILPTDGDKCLRPFWTLQEKVVCMAVDANLRKTDGGYALSADVSSVKVGGYHVEFMTDISTMESAVMLSLLSQVKPVFEANGLIAYPAYANGVLRIRVGSFVTEYQAQSMLETVTALYPLFNTAVVGPSETSVIVIDPETDRILFSYDCADGSSLGMQAIRTGTEAAYIKAQSSNVYDGVLAYNRFADQGHIGVSVTSVVTLDQYVEAVLPYEISNSWPIETQKAFAIAARSYAVHQLLLHRHSADHFDVCNDIHCQTYCGAGRVNQNVLDAVRATHGLVITYGNEIAVAYYTSSCGGCTVSVGDVWGGENSPYLVAHDTPWERYSEYYNGFWTVEISPYTLLTYLRGRGYTELDGTITNIEILSLAPGSTYVKSLRITASNGASIVINNTDRVRLALSAYLKSANFVVGRGSVAYTVDTVEALHDVEIDAGVKTVRAPLSAAQAAFLPSDPLVGATSDPSGALLALTGEASSDLPGQVLSLLTDSDTSSPAASNGLLDGFLTGIDRLAARLTAVPAITRTVKEYTVHTETKVAHASSDYNFIFVGKGWGHGTGLSQYGAKDIADLGYDYETIIDAYYTGVTISDYRLLGNFQ